MTKSLWKYKYKNNDDYLVQAIVDEVILENKEYPIKDNPYGIRFKNVFACTPIPLSNDERFRTCITWERQVIKKGDLISFKGYFTKDAFIVKGLSVLKKAEET